MRDVINMLSMRSRGVWLSLLLVLFSMGIDAQEHIRFVTYNVENLFDCVDDSLTSDEDFLPSSLRHWTPYRYRAKLQAIARTITTIGGSSAPDFVALCEVENDSVLSDLTTRSSLRSVGYKYLMTSSLDPRGIDVALLYKPTTFRPFDCRSLRLPSSSLPDGGHVRDILCVSGRLVTGDTLDILVCHLPSRINGRKSAYLRRRVVEYMRQTVDSLAAYRATSRVVLMGDFNDEPHNMALRPLLDDGSLVCITDTLKGSYRYKGHWEQIDHIILSNTLMGDDRLRLSSRGAWVDAQELLVEPDPLYGGRRPKRTYNGMKYIGGTSDHLPVCFDLEFSWDNY